MIETARLKWLGRIAKMVDNVPCRIISFFRSEGSRKKGRLGLRWLDSVLKYLKTLEVNV
jgi:hypothetical protein